MNILRHPVFPYVIPFGTFLLLTGLASWTPAIVTFWFYPVKTVLVGALLLMFRRTYVEVKPKISLLAIVAGLFVFALWILPEGYYPLLGQSKGFNPYQFSSQSWSFVWISFRMIGAVVVVPIMEELFWRSFLLRYLINPDFKKVPLGAFSWLSFCGTVVFFGLEHHRWLPGIAAGIIYTLLLYRRKKLFDCIFAHAITNLTLGVYVLATRQWGYW